MSNKNNIPILRFKGFDGEWKFEKLKDISKIERGRFSPRPRNNPIYYNGIIPFVQTSDVVNANGKIEFYTQTLNEKGLVVSKLFPKGSILITIAANIGHSGVLQIDMACPDSLIGIKPNSNIHNYYLNYYLSTHQKKMDYLAPEGAQKNINIEFLNPYKIPFPTLPEQQKIASFLSAVDEKIQQLSRKKELLSQYKKGIMQQLFSGKLRFKDENGEDYADWEEKKIKEIFVVTRGNVLSMTLISDKQNENNKYPVYSSQTKKNGLSGYYDKFLFEDCITWTTDGAGAGDVNFRKGKFYCTNVCGVLKSDKGYANVFIAEILNTISRKYVSYVGNPKLMNNVMSEILISIPKSIKEQQKIANFLSSIDAKIESASQQINQTQSFKKGLLQQLFV